MIAETPAEAARGAGLVCLCLTDANAVEAVVFGPGGLVEVEGLTRIIDFSSIRPDTSRDIAARLKQATGAGWIDAPVSGGVPGAEQGTLAIMAGGADEDVAVAAPLVEPLCARFTHMGPVGAGQTAKLANQIIVALNIAAVSEAMVLATKAGVDPEKVFQAIRGGLAGSTVMDAKAPLMMDRSFDPGFRIDLHIKDMANALETSRSVGAPLPLAAQAMEIMLAIKQDGCGVEDHSSIVKFYEKLANIEVTH